jgi:tartrate dehydrogenase/decarboxylase / D-malate dehydrogenase
MRAFQIAVIAGDGVGKEVVPEGIRVLEAAGQLFEFRCHWRAFDWSCETYVQTGKMMPGDGLRQLRPFEAIFLGAVGHPSVPDHVSLWGLLIPIRRAFRQYVSLRPARLFDGIESPLKHWKPGEIDFIIVRENNEGEYSNTGGRLYEGTGDEMAVQQTVFTRRGVNRILRFAFELARKRRKHLTSEPKKRSVAPPGADDFGGGTCAVPESCRENQTIAGSGERCGEQYDSGLRSIGRSESRAVRRNPRRRSRNERMR